MSAIGPRCCNCYVTLKKRLWCPCKHAVYCSKECQKAQWKEHKKEFHKDDVKKNSTRSKEMKKEEFKEYDVRFMKEKKKEEFEEYYVRFMKEKKREFTAEDMEEYFRIKGEEEEEPQMVRFVCVRVVVREKTHNDIVLYRNLARIILSGKVLPLRKKCLWHPWVRDVRAFCSSTKREKFNYELLNVGESHHKEIHTHTHTHIDTTGTKEQRQKIMDHLEREIKKKDPTWTPEQDE